MKQRTGKYNNLVYSALIQEYPHDPVEFIGRLRAKYEPKTVESYLGVMRGDLQSDLPTLLRVMTVANGEKGRSILYPYVESEQPTLSDIFQCRKWVVKSLVKLLSISDCTADPHVKQIVARLKWKEHGELVKELFPGVMVYKRMRERFHAPYKDHDPQIIGCHGGKCGEMRPISKQSISYILNGGTR